jgi:ribosome-binding factor A
MSPPPRGRGNRRRGQGFEPASRSGSHRYPRAARVNKVLQEVVAESLERLGSRDERLTMLTVTDVLCEPDLRAATVLFASLTERQRQALAGARARLQAEVGRQVRLKRTPLLSFDTDPAVASGDRIEEILRGLGSAGGPAGGDLGGQDPGGGGPGPAGPA